MNETKDQDPTTASTQAKAQRRARSLQPRSRRSEDEVREQIKRDIERTILAIRQGHLTGGYVITEELQAEEKKLHAILSTELEEAEHKHGTHHRSEFQHPEVRKLKLALAGLSYKPKLVVSHE